MESRKFFFFKQKTAYEMLRSLVGSEMCIRDSFWRVFVPSLVGWIASLGVISVFLAAYDIPVSFHTLMRICGGNSIANVTSVTPGGAGVTQAFNVASLSGVATSTQATAYSV